MMKQFFIGLLVFSSFAALSVSPAFAQSNPNTTQTDQSEEDWRKSKKKTAKDDPWNGFKNTNSWGQGTQRTMSPVDRLPEDSRRFLMKERAQRMAQAGIGEPVDARFEPSPEAKTDPNLESDEKTAWSEMMKDMGGSGGGTGSGTGGISAGGAAAQKQAGDPNGDPNSQDGEQAGGASQMPSQIPTQVGEIGGAGSATPSVMRGGSSASVSDILAQIKGGGAATQSQQAQGQYGQQGQAQSGQSQQPQGTAPTAAQMQAEIAAQAQAQAQAQANTQGDAQSQASTQEAAKASADAQAQASAAAAAQAQADAAAQAAASRTPEAISPLDRLKKSSDERASQRRRTSASDYLNNGN